MSNEHSTPSVHYAAIPGFPGYRAGSDGTIWSCWKRVTRGTQRGGTFGVASNEWKQLKAYLLVSDRRQYTLVVNGKHITRKGAQLVCLAFHGAAPEGTECCHKDGDCTNDKPSNLSWASHSENEKDKKRHGTNAKGERTSHAKLTTSNVTEILRRAANGDRPVDIAREFPVSDSAIRAVIKRRNWAHV